MRNIIWTDEALKFLFTMVVKHFGPHNKWKRERYPEGKKEEYENFCNHFASVVKAKSGVAVEHQIRWAITLQKNIKQPHMKLFLKNKTIANAAGFIENDYLPETIKISYVPIIYTKG